VIKTSIIPEEESGQALKPPILIGGRCKPTNAIYLLFKNITSNKVHDVMFLKRR
jgi:hypothetical protein